ncbi:hypothetical protein MKQ70_30105 [Chitinophaga sedimenti]|uniref:hypothetical protein n=1 Tax=Chitinophaga sedimenti TaxID=2033606 RepID=UPI002003A9FC|nr:hypothetical protein [Chitinophaga sedimenti]MCK7559003.1 hypothetical protein [Chitinophaga sedimenti]
MGANIEYVLVKTLNQYTHQPINVIMAKALLGKYFKAEAENADFDAFKEGDKLIPWTILSSFKGSQLENLRYEQLLPFAQPEEGDPFRVIWATSSLPKMVPVSCIPRRRLVRTIIASVKSMASAF